MIICDIILWDDPNRTLSVQEKDLDKVLESVLAPYYKNGYTNTANSIKKTLKKELEYYNRCNNEGKTYVPLTKDNDFNRNESFQYVINNGIKEFI